jgi:hypothetical protein
LAHGCSGPGLVSGAAAILLARGTERLACRRRCPVKAGWLQEN